MSICLDSIIDSVAQYFCEPQEGSAKDQRTVTQEITEGLQAVAARIETVVDQAFTALAFLFKNLFSCFPESHSSRGG